MNYGLKCFKGNINNIRNQYFFGNYQFLVKNVSLCLTFEEHVANVRDSFYGVKKSQPWLQIYKTLYINPCQEISLKIQLVLLKHD